MQSTATPTPNRVTSRRLGFIERTVGTHHRIPRFGVRSSQQGNANADGDRDRVSIELQGLQRNLQTKAFTQCLGFVRRGVRQEDGELLATGSAKDIPHSRVSADHPCDVFEYGIASRMAPGVIDLLEVIQVERKHAYVLAMQGCATCS